MDVDHNIWGLVTQVVGSMLGEGIHEEDILKKVMHITHGTVEWDSVKREIQRQKRMVIN